MFSLTSCVSASAPEDAAPGAVARTESVAPGPLRGGHASTADAADDDLEGAQAIWPQTDELPGQHQVALFRHTFDVDRTYDKILFHVFADTRYELWFAGEQVFRGPARFDKLVHEYDTYDTWMTPGQHSVVVRVQWAPNIRRSESTSPHLLVSVVGHNDDEATVLAVTDDTWRGVVSDAWEMDSAPIHDWGLIGPAEILDLRRLPRDWADPQFDDAGWPMVDVVEGPVAEHRVRTTKQIWQSKFEPFLQFVIGSGTISPGRKLFELIPGERPEITFMAEAETSVVLEATTDLEHGVPELLVLDGETITLSRHDYERPGLLRAHVAIEPGPHRLALDPAVDRPTSVAIGTAGLILDFGGLHTEHPRPGERTLLADLHDDTSDDPRPEVTELSLRQGARYAVLDLGRTMHGRLTFTAEGQSGTVLDVGFSERLFNGRPLPYAGPLYPQMSQVDSFVLDGTERTVSSIDARAGRYVLLLSHAPDGPLRLSDITFVEETFPALHRGSFECADSRLNTVWRVGKKTVQANMIDAYADPWRERGQWWGDAFVADQVNRVTFGDSTLLRRGIDTMGRAFGDDGRPAALAPNNDGTHLLDYGMLWVQSLRQYAQLRPDDRAFLESQHQIATAFADYLTEYHAVGTHLIDLPERHWSENGVVDWPAYHSRNGLSAAMNALYAQTLRELAALAAELGHSADSAGFSARAARVASDMNDLLLDDGRYKATRLDGELVDAISPHPQAWPLAAGVVPDAHVQSVADAALELLSGDPEDANIGTYGMYWLLEGLAEAGRYDEALEVIRTYYGFMLDHGATTWWESFEAAGDWSQSLSHGWGAAPTWFLSARVLGAEQIGPSRWSVRPSFDGLEWARGAVPIGDDKLEVRWTGSVERCSDRSVELQVPEGTTGSVELRQVPAVAEVTIDGLPTAQNRAAAGGDQADGDLLVNVDMPGHHVIEIRSGCDE